MNKTLIERIADIDHDLPNVLDSAAIVVIFGALLSWLPSISAMLAIIWYVIRIIETDTFKRLFLRKKKKDSDETGATKSQVSTPIEP